MKGGYTFAEETDSPRHIYVYNIHSIVKRTLKMSIARVVAAVVPTLGIDTFKFGSSEWSSSNVVKKCWNEMSKALETKTNGPTRKRASRFGWH